MKPTALQYPIFEANQVLTNVNLNELFIYLDEQERLTRTNLIGIGIVCGLELSLVPGTETTGPTIGISKGCGVTSEGYLIIESADQALVSYRKYVPPSAISYSLFERTNPPQLDLWELFPAGIPSTDPLTNDFVNNKVVLLFLELKKEDLRNCSAVDCNDKGADVQVSLRRLLIAQKDLDDIIKDINDQKTGEIPADSEAMVLARLNLPNLRLPRYDVPNTTPVTSAEVLEAFIKVFQGGRFLAKNTQEALSKAYAVFHPVLGDLYPKGTDPFSGFAATFNFLDSAPDNTGQVRFLQYYYDLFDDLIKAYDEFRWKGVDLLCACCPSEKLFPRHLMLGLLTSAGVTTSTYRHHFLASSAISNCEERTRELRLLFQRLVEMTIRFTDKPLLPVLQLKALRDNQIRITPSKLGDVPLSEKAIPYYYTQNGTPPLYQLWSPEKTRRNRANQNLGYFAGTYALNDFEFVTDPLRYDLEPYNFLRIEGHLNKDYQVVLRTLLQLKAEYRLPFDIIALRTGVFDDKKTIDLEKEKIRFQDLEAMYDTLRSTILGKWGQHLAFFYQLPDPRTKDFQDLQPPKVTLLSKYEPTLILEKGKFGAYFENLIWKKIGDKTDFNTIAFGQNIQDIDEILRDIAIALAKFSEVLPADLAALKIDQLAKRFVDLRVVTKNLEVLVEQPSLVSQRYEAKVIDNIDDRLEAIIYDCQLEPFQAIHTEYLKRLREAKQAQFLSFFLQQHPGIQHKAGVPLGGTFILVYHEETPKADVTPIKPNLEVVNSFSAIDKYIYDKSFNELAKDLTISKNPNFINIFQLLRGEPVTLIDTIVKPDLSPLERILAATEADLPNGTVIADFYLPYSFNSNGTPIQFVLPPPPVVFSMDVGCTEEINGKEAIANVTIKTQSGTGPFSVKVDGAEFNTAWNGTFVPLAPGPHRIILRDAAGVESIEQTVNVPEPLRFENVKYTYVDIEEQSYDVEFDIKGGNGKYTVDTNTNGTLANTATFSATGLTLGEKNYKVTIIDGSNCEKTIELKPFRITKKIGCTDKEGLATVEVDVEGGTTPYSYILDSGTSGQKIPSRIAAGKHTLAIRDNANQTSVFRIEIPYLLNRTEPAYRLENKTYVATFEISGGTQPYFLKEGTGGKPQQISKTVKISLEPAAKRNYTISDSNKCTIPVPLAAPKLPIPCKGKSIRCAYRLWLQPLLNDARYNNDFVIGEIKLTYTYEGNQQTISLPGFSLSPDILNTNFNDSITKIVAELNQSINKALNNIFGETEFNRLSMTYRKDPNYPFAVLLIERFLCESFELNFVNQVSIGNKDYLNSIAYTIGGNKPGVTLEYKGSDTVFVPAFACETGDRTEPDKEPRFDSKCKKSLPPPGITAIRDSPDGGGGVVTIKDDIITIPSSIRSLSGPANLGDEQIVSWVWDVNAGSSQEALFFTRQTIPIIASLGQGKSSGTLTVITADGCFSFSDYKIG